jgi:hypothetical protein
MMRLSMAGMVIVSAMVGGCAIKQQPAPPPPKIVHEVAPASAEPPPPTAEEILAAQPAEVRAAVKEHARKGKWPSYRTAAYILYPYNEGGQPIVDCAPLRTTDLQLQAGETARTSPWVIRKDGWRRQLLPVIPVTRFLTLH